MKARQDFGIVASLLTQSTVQHVVVVVVVVAAAAGLVHTVYKGCFL